ncbi:XRE family transcriptional regulator [Vespertiliibacter pulmonis]|nr:LexA family transcriptional regulator [Vespertiliibacter pulmonis]
MKKEETLPFKILFKQKRTELGYTQKDVAERTNTSPTLISKYEKGLAKPRIETAKRIAELLKIDLTTLIESLTQEEVYLTKIPFYLTEFDEDEFLYIPNTLLPNNVSPSNFLAYKYQGNSMEPILQHGDTLIVNTTYDMNDNCFNKDIFLVMTDDNVYTRHIAVGDKNNFIIYASNNMYQSFEISHQRIEIIGKVIWRSGFI